MKKRNNPCIMCGECFVKRHTHHNIPRYKIKNNEANRKKVFNKDNEFSLCPNCHSIVHEHNINLRYFMSTKGMVVMATINNKTYIIDKTVYCEI